MTKLPTLVLASLLAVVTGAQAAPKIERLRGTVEAVSGDGFTVKTLDGASESVVLAPDAKVSWVVPSSLDGIKDGVFIGTATKGEPRWPSRSSCSPRRCAAPARGITTGT